MTVNCLINLRRRIRESEPLEEPPLLQSHTTQEQRLTIERSTLPHPTSKPEKKSLREYVIEVRKSLKDLREEARAKGRDMLSSNPSVPSSISRQEVKGKGKAKADYSHRIGDESTAKTPRRSKKRLFGLGRHRRDKSIGAEHAALTADSAQPSLESCDTTTSEPPPVPCLSTPTAGHTRTFSASKRPPPTLSNIPPFSPEELRGLPKELTPSSPAPPAFDTHSVPTVTGSTDTADSVSEGHGLNFLDDTLVQMQHPEGSLRDLTQSGPAPQSFGGQYSVVTPNEMYGRYPASGRRRAETVQGNVEPPLPADTRRQWRRLSTRNITPEEFRESPRIIEPVRTFHSQLVPPAPRFLQQPIEPPSRTVGSPYMLHAPHSSVPGNGPIGSSGSPSDIFETPYVPQVQYSLPQMIGQLNPPDLPSGMDKSHHSPQASRVPVQVIQPSARMIEASSHPNPRALADVFPTTPGNLDSPHPQNPEITLYQMRNSPQQTDGSFTSITRQPTPSSVAHDPSPAPPSLSAVPQRPRALTHGPSVTGEADPDDGVPPTPTRRAPPPPPTSGPMPPVQPSTGAAESSDSAASHGAATSEDAGSPRPPADQETSRQLRLLPGESNDFAGFCEGAWRLQVGQVDGAYGAIRVNPGVFGPSVKFLKCKSCKFWLMASSAPPAGPRGRFVLRRITNAPLAAPDRTVLRRGGIMYRPEWLFRSHVAWAQPSPPEDAMAGRFRCLFCCAEGWPAPIIPGGAAFFEHLQEHRWRQPSGPVLGRAAAVVGRSVRLEEDFDVALPAVES